MDPLKAFGLCSMLITAPLAGQDCSSVEHVSSPLINRWQPEITQASRRFDIPEDWIRAVMKQESAGLTTLNGQPITSRAGAMGLMQLMPGTWSEMQDRYCLGHDPYSPRDNILAGTAYLREMYARYGYPYIFAAYHAGPARMDAFFAGDRPLPDATKTYLKSIVPGVEIASFQIENPTRKLTKSSPNSLFFVRSEGEISSSEPSKSTAKTVKFVSKTTEVGNEIDRSPSGDPAHRANDLFVPLMHPGR